MHEKFPVSMLRVPPVSEVNTFERVMCQTGGGVYQLHELACVRIGLKGCPEGVGLQELCIDCRFESCLIQVPVQFDDITQVVVLIILAPANG